MDGAADDVGRERRSADVADDGDGDPAGDRLGEGETDVEGDSVGDGEAVGDGETEHEGDFVGDGATDREGDFVGVGDGEADGVREAEGDWDREFSALGSGLTLSETFLSTRLADCSWDVGSPSPYRSRLRMIAISTTLHTTRAAIAIALA